MGGTSRGRLLIPLAALLGTTLLAADDPPQQKPAPPGAAARDAQRKAEAEIRSKLTQRLDVTLVDTPFSDVLAFLSSKTGIDSIRFDKIALQDEGIKPPAITLSLEKATLAQVLHRILEPHYLTWIIENESLVITTLVRADTRMTTVVYPVGKLLKVPKGGVGADAADSSPAQELVNLLMNSTLGPWEAIDGSGGTISSLGNTVVVRQTRMLHDEVAGILDGLEMFADGKLNHEELALRPGWYSRSDDARLRDGLAARVPTIDFTETPLPKALEFLAAQTNVRFAIDRKALQEEGIEVDLKITLKAQNLTLRSTLGLILAPHDLAALIDHGSIEITSVVDEDNKLSSTLYDVTDPLENGTGIKEIGDVIQTETEGPWESIDGSGGTLSYFRGRVLVICQTQRMHEQISQLLADLRAAAVAEEPRPAKESR